MCKRKPSRFRLSGYGTLARQGIALCLLCVTPVFGKGLVEVPEGINHSAWDELLRKYVNARGMVDYGAWHDSREDRKKLDDYLMQFAPKSVASARRDERIASLINAYNAFTIDFISFKASNNRRT